MLSSILCLGAGAFAATSHARVVYDNTRTYQHRGMLMLFPTRADGAEIGDEVHLAGTARVLVSMKIRFWYGGKAACSFDCKLRLRGLRPDKLTPGPGIRQGGKITGYRNTESPGQPIFESKVYKAVKAEPGMNEYTFDLPKVRVDDRIVWTIEAFHGKGIVGDLGPAYYDVPTIGSSEDFFWQSERRSAWIAYSWDGEPVANFGARIYAIDRRVKR